MDEFNIEEFAKMWMSCKETNYSGLVPIHSSGYKKFIGGLKVLITSAVEERGCKQCGKYIGNICKECQKQNEKFLNHICIPDNTLTARVCKICGQSVPFEDNRITTSTPKP